MAYKAIEGATVFCKMRGNPYVELVHWVQQLLNAPDSDVHRIINHFELDPSRLAKDVTDALDRLPRGATSISDLSSHVENAVERGWVYGTLMFGDAQVRTGHLLVGMLKTPSLRNALVAISASVREDQGRHADRRFRAHRGGLVGGHADGQRRVVAGGTWRSQRRHGAAQMGKQEALKKFATDLTERARKGEIDPDHRTRRRDPADRRHPDAASSEQPDPDRRSRRRQDRRRRRFRAADRRRATCRRRSRTSRCDTLDIGLLQAGASMKGEFENRLRQVIDEVQASPKPIILFIDEAHTLIGAGGAAGTGDAANLLKPALARGTLRTIAATTWAEYKKHIEKDPALTRRFQVVQVDEPSEDKAILMMRGVARRSSSTIACRCWTKRSRRRCGCRIATFPARQLPDKAVSLLDTACARVAISQHAVPPEVEDCRRIDRSLETELEIIGARGSRRASTTADRRQAARRKACRQEQRRVELEERWNAERELVNRVLEIRATLRKGSAPVEGTGSKLEETAKAQSASASTPADGPSPEERAALARRALRTCKASCEELQGESPLILPTVDEQAVASVVPDWTGIPVGRMVKDEIEAVLHLADTLNQRVIGQKHALEMIARRIQTSRAKLDNPEQAHRRLHAGGPVGRRQDRDRAGAGRGALRRRAERHHDQHERIPGGAHGLHAQGFAARVRGLRRRRRAHRSGAAPAVQRGAARRS